ncbi:MAG: hypothetical protein CR968_03420 [Flavobacteriia bacterium]|nr:MAG: hypothetical protein CR968_03420 [Flavobacteriia bacterium]
MINNRFYILLAIFGLLLTSNVQAQNADQRMKELVEQRKQNNLTSNDHTVFKIQIYNGLSESKAKSVRNDFDRTFVGYGSELSYTQPEWKVQVGRFSSEIAAYKALERIRKKFPGAFRLKVR